jgi:GTP pyrophosphokinase
MTNVVKVRETTPVLPDGTVDLKAWLNSLVPDKKPEEIVLIKAVCDLAKQYGEKTSIPWGENAFFQGLGMGEILNELGMDAVSVSAGILYYTFRYGNIPQEQLASSIEPLVAKLLQSLKNMEQIDAAHVFEKNEKHRFRQHAENLRKMLLAVVEDVRVVLIKLTEHLCKMRYATQLSKPVQRQLAYEAKEIYAPLANRLGIGQVKWELEDLMFRFLEPVTYKKIATLLDERRIDREKYIKTVKDSIESSLKEANIDSSVTGRAKHIYSIWRKMQRKMLPYHEIYDVRAFRVLVPEVKDCYGALGIIHSLWHHIPKEFDDYIANAKENGYQSLHTAVLGPNGKPLEVQIRTVKMHEQAELGVASHWRYKEGLVHDPHYEKKLNYLRQLLDWQETLVQDQITSHENENENEDEIEGDFFEECVYVLTPTGNVLELPNGSTPIDFAYAIHTDIGHRCRGAKSNGKILSLNHTLKSGQQIEIITTKTGGPSRDWLNPHLKYVQSTRAKSKIHQWFKRQDRDENIVLGKELVQRELKRLSVESISFEILKEQFPVCKTVEDFFAAVGSGDIRVAQVLGAIQRIVKPLSSQTVVKLPRFDQTASHVQDYDSSKLDRDEITVEGVGNLMCRIARCCKPVLGDEIIGYISKGMGVSVHRKDCMNVLKTQEKQSARLIEVAWGNQSNHQYYSADILVLAYDRKGLIRDITSLLAVEKVNVLAFDTKTDKSTHIATSKIHVEISGIEALGKALSKIQQIQNVIEVKRLIS